MALSIDSLQEFRDARQTARDQPRTSHAPDRGADIAAESTGNAIRELADRLVEEAARASEFRVRLELTEQAASSVREELAEERRRREAAERERDDLRRELQARTIRGLEPPAPPEPPEPREEPDTSPVHPERAEPAEPVDPQREEPERAQPSESHESAASPGPTRTPTDAGGGPQEGRERPWWRRMFGG